MSKVACDLFDDDAAISSLLVMAGLIAESDEAGSGFEFVIVNRQVFVDECRVRKHFNARRFVERIQSKPMTDGL